MDKLYELNKDMLVKLVYTIQADTKKELEKCEEELEFILSETISSVDRCSEYKNGCKAMRLYLFVKDRYRECEDMVFCNMCGLHFCNNHCDTDLQICISCSKK